MLFRVSWKQQLMKIPKLIFWFDGIFYVSRYSNTNTKKQIHIYKYKYKYKVNAYRCVSPGVCGCRPPSSTHDSFSQPFSCKSISLFSCKNKFNVFNIVVFYSPAKALFLLSFILLQKDVFNIPLLLQKISLTVLSFVKSSAKLWCTNKTSITGHSESLPQYATRFTLSHNYTFQSSTKIRQHNWQCSLQEQEEVPIINWLSEPTSGDSQLTEESSNAPRSRMISPLPLSYGQPQYLNITINPSISISRASSGYLFHMGNLNNSISQYLNIKRKYLYHMGELNDELALLVLLAALVSVLVFPAWQDNGGFDVGGRLVITRILTIT